MTSSVDDLLRELQETDDEATIELCALALVEGPATPDDLARLLDHERGAVRRAAGANALAARSSDWTLGVHATGAGLSRLEPAAGVKLVLRGGIGAAPDRRREAPRSRAHSWCVRGRARAHGGAVQSSGRAEERIGGPPVGARSLCVTILVVLLAVPAAPGTARAGPRIEDDAVGWAAERIEAWDGAPGVAARRAIALDLLAAARRRDIDVRGAFRTLLGELRRTPSPALCPRDPAAACDLLFALARDPFDGRGGDPDPVVPRDLLGLARLTDPSADLGPGDAALRRARLRAGLVLRVEPPAQTLAALSLLAPSSPDLAGLRAGWRRVAPVFAVAVRMEDDRDLPWAPDGPGPCDGCPACGSACAGRHGHARDLTRLRRAAREGRPWEAFDLLMDASGRSPATILADGLITRAAMIDAATRGSIAPSWGSGRRSLTVAPAPVGAREGRWRRALELLDAAEQLPATRCADPACELGLDRLRGMILEELAAIARPPRLLPTWAAWDAMGPDERMTHVVAALADLRGSDMALPGASPDIPVSPFGHAQALGWSALPALLPLLEEGWHTVGAQGLEPVAELAGRWIDTLAGARLVGDADVSRPGSREAVHRRLAAWWRTWGGRGELAFHLDGAARPGAGQEGHLIWLAARGQAAPIVRMIYLGLVPAARRRVIHVLGDVRGPLGDDDLRREARVGELAAVARCLLAHRRAVRASELGATRAMSSEISSALDRAAAPLGFLAASRRGQRPP